MILASFLLQMVLAVLAFIAGRRLSTLSNAKAATLIALALAATVAFPLMRVWPVPSLRLFGAPLVSITEFTGMAIPAGLLFGMLVPRLPRVGDRRAVYALLGLSLVYFVKAGWWMVSPGVGDLGVMKWKDGVCLQSTDSTCVAVSMVTLLRSRGVEATETEMAALSFVEPGGGTTDSRAAWALERKLASVGRRDLKVRYQRMTLDELIAAPKPCMVPLNWGFFMSHMVCVMDANSETITLGDPLSGRRTMTVPEFTGEWNGLVMWLD